MKEREREKRGGERRGREGKGIKEEKETYFYDLYIFNPPLFLLLRWRADRIVQTAERMGDRALALSSLK